jgi:hypothetical protein
MDAEEGGAVAVDTAKLCSDPQPTANPFRNPLLLRVITGLYS